MITYVESDSHSSDSDYEPQPKPIQNCNIGLHEPTQSRLRAQMLISASNAEKGSDSFPVRATNSAQRQTMSSLFRNVLLLQQCEHSHYSCSSEHCNCAKHK